MDIDEFLKDLLELRQKHADQKEHKERVLYLLKNISRFNKTEKKRIIGMARKLV